MNNETPAAVHPAPERTLQNPSQIAAGLSAAQVRALRDPNGCSVDDFHELIHMKHAEGHIMVEQPWILTEFGLAVLAEIEGAKE